MDDAEAEVPLSVPPQLPTNTSTPQLLQSQRWGEESRDEESQKLSHTPIHDYSILDWIFTEVLPAACRALMLTGKLNKLSHEERVMCSENSSFLARSAMLPWVCYLATLYQPCYTLYPEWPHRQGGLACFGCTFESRWCCTDLYYARGAQGVLPMRVGGTHEGLRRHYP